MKSTKIAPKRNTGWHFLSISKKLNNFFLSSYNSNSQLIMVKKYEFNTRWSKKFRHFSKQFFVYKKRNTWHLFGAKYVKCFFFVDNQKIFCVRKIPNICRVGQEICGFKKSWIFFVFQPFLMRFFAIKCRILCHFVCLFTLYTQTL